MATYSLQLDPKGCNFFNTGIPATYLENGTNIPVSGIGFDAGTVEQIFFEFKVPFYLSGNLTVNLRWYSQTGQTTGAVIWGAQIAALTAGDAQSVLTDSLATATTTTTTVNGTARGPTATQIVVSNLDSLAADDTVQMRIYRDAAAGGDTMTGDAILFDIEIEYAATGGTGSGDVTGPGSATDNAVARYDLTTGKVIQNSGVIVDDSNNVSGMGTLACGAITTSGNVNELTPRFVGFARLTSAHTSSGTGIQDITGTSISFPSAGTYVFEYELSSANSSTTGTPTYTVTAAGGTISGFLLLASIPTTTTTETEGTSTTNGTGVAGAARTVSTAVPVKLRGSFVATASGTVVARITMSANAITTAIGSWGRLMKIA